MKKFVLMLLCFNCALLFSQVEGKKEITESEADSLGNIKTKGIKYGVSFGFNYTFDELVDTKISPIDKTLTLQETSQTSFLISTSVSFPILKSWFSGSYYRKLNEEGEPFGRPYFVPYGLSVVATINLVTFNSALGGSGLFNQKLDGGLGLGYTFGDNVQLALTYEMISFRQPRDFVKQLENQTINVNGNNLENLSLDDNDYFIDKYMDSIALKVVYILN